MNLLSTLNDKQKEAVLATEGRVRIVAGAGSGKTRVIAYRYAHLVNDIGISPANILCMTFTNKAAKEMRSRISKLVHAWNVNDYICTIHGFCVKLLRQEIHRFGVPKNFNILDIEDCKQLAKQVFDDMHIKRDQQTVKSLLGQVADYKEHKPYISNILLGKKDFLPSEINPIIRFLQLQLQHLALDFDDLVYFTIFILEHFDDAREYWTDVLNYIMVDEVQDCNFKDWRIINILHSKHRNLFIVGDPDQSIYEWRGAKPSMFIDFKSDKDIILSQNYRSTPNILELANKIIENNTNRIPKNLFTTRDKASNTYYYHAITEVDESLFVCNKIRELIDSGVNLNEIAILYRASYVSLKLEQQLTKSQIDYTVWGGVRFYERKEIKDAISYLRLIEFDDDIAFQRIVNIPSRKFGDKSMEKVKIEATQKGISMFDALVSLVNNGVFKNKANIPSFIELINECREFKKISTIAELFDYMLMASGLKELYRFNNDTDRLENLEELLASIKYYEDSENAGEGEATLENYLQDIALFTNMDSIKDGDYVKLMTIHQAKGLEIPYVFIIGLSEGILPNYRTIRERDKNGLEEERRLMYVAATRAEKMLYLSDSDGYNLQAQMTKIPSRFLTEIPYELVDMDKDLDRDRIFDSTRAFIKHQESQQSYHYPSESELLEINDIVFNQYFGRGTVIEKYVNTNTIENRYKIDFGNNKTRWLSGHALIKL